MALVIDRCGYIGGQIGCIDMTLLLNINRKIQSSGGFLISSQATRRSFYIRKPTVDQFEDSDMTQMLVTVSDKTVSQRN